MGAKRDIKTVLFRFVLVTFYIVLGAAIFYGIEHTGGSEYNKEVARKERLYNETKRNIIRQFGINDTEYEWLVARVVDAKSDTPLEWSFSRGLDLCMQTVTTIGYGNKPPTTQAGQLFFIPYALFGIPLTVLLLNTIGENLSHLIRFLLGKFEKKVLGRKEVNKSELKCLIIINFFIIFLLFIMAGVSIVAEDWTFAQGLYVWFVTFTTIGFGDFIPGQGADSKSGIGVVLYRLILITIGLSLVSTIFNTIGDFAEKRGNSSASKLCDGCFSLSCCSRDDSVEADEAHEMEQHTNGYDKKTSSNNEMHMFTDKNEDKRVPITV